MTPLALVLYYANLLILQYLQKPKAFANVQALANLSILPQATVQSVSFTGTPASGTFVLNYRSFGVGISRLPTAAINWNDSASTIQTKLQAVAGLGSVLVTGSIPSGLVITFVGVNPVVSLLTVTLNSLATSGAIAVPVTLAETDVTLPLAISLAFNLDPLLGTVASGVQLDVLGKYAGVTRFGSLTTGAVTLGDADFFTLIQFATLRNSAKSDLASIQQLLHNFFPNEVFVFDYQNMQMSYMISSTIGSQTLAQLLVSDNLLMRPMGVSLGATIYAPVLNTFFGFRTYSINTANNSPFNSYSSYQTNRPWLSYSNAIFS